jgi:hypothetical protein
MADEQQINGNQDQGHEYQQEEQAAQNGGEHQEENVESQAQTGPASDGGPAGLVGQQTLIRPVSSD